MDRKFDWLDEQIDRMRADRSLVAYALVGGYEPDESDVALLQMSAKLNSLRPGVGSMSPEFLDRLRERVLTSVEDHTSDPVS